MAVMLQHRLACREDLAALAALMNAAMQNFRNLF
jgi:hypothetical protein